MRTECFVTESATSINEAGEGVATGRGVGETVGTWNKKKSDKKKDANIDLLLHYVNQDSQPNRPNYQLTIILQGLFQPTSKIIDNW